MATTTSQSFCIPV